MLTRMLKPNDVLKVSAFGTLTFALIGYAIPEDGGQQRIAVSVGSNSGRPPVLHVGGACILLNRANCVFSVLSNSWFKIDEIGFKVFRTGKDGKLFPKGGIRVSIDAPAEVEIHQC